MRDAGCGWDWAEDGGEGEDRVWVGARCESEKWMAEVAAEAEAETGAEIEAWAESTSQIMSSTSFFLGR